MVHAIEWVDGKVIMLDQTKLPFEVSYLVCTDYLMVAEGIRKLRIRGAPAIGIAAAMGIALAAQEISARDYSRFVEALHPVFEEMLSTRPTAVNIFWAVERVKEFLQRNRDNHVLKLKEMLVREAQAILDEDIAVNKAIGRWGAEFINDGDTILTHCNAGSLATGGYGTATAPILVARDQGKHVSVIADETRPVLQGARLTAWELMQENIPVTLITDSTAGSLLRGGEIDLVIVGTDRTARNGDVANKIGTYPLAVLSHVNRVPFYVAAPMSSIDFSVASGEAIPIEERSPDEVTAVLGKYPIAPDGVKARNIAFDVTPRKYITAIITERGAFRPKDIRKLSRSDADLSGIRLKRYKS
jgi:methylthioribose-1-phosphate isomerase